MPNPSPLDNQAADSTPKQFTASTVSSVQAIDSDVIDLQDERESTEDSVVTIDEPEDFQTAEAAAADIPAVQPDYDTGLAKQQLTAEGANDELVAETSLADKPTNKMFSILGHASAFVREHWVLGSACCLCLSAGSLLGIWLRPSSPTPPQAEAEQPSQFPAKTIFAATSRRHEPIQPLQPFVNLDPAIVELGKRLFHEPALSINGRASCATCHPLNQGGTTSVPVPAGVNGQLHRYNAPSVFNAALNCAQLWDGSVATLEEQVEGPVTNPHELGSSWERVTKFLKQDSYYSRTFMQSMQGEPTPERVRTALATFLRSLVTLNSKFDQWLTGTEEALNSDEFGGYYLFKKYDCIGCHQGPGVGGSMFQPLGIAKAYFKEDASNSDLGRYQFTEREKDRYVFRVPQLRNVELTAPYLHNGAVPTLEAAVALMIEYPCGQEVNQEDVRRITAFLKTLTGELPKDLRGVP